LTGDGVFKGFYVRLSGIEEQGGEITKFTEELRTIPFEWYKIRDA
jgi:hypothetical protein